MRQLALFWTLLGAWTVVSSSGLGAGSSSGLGGPFYPFTVDFDLSQSILSEINQEVIMKSRSLQQYRDRVQKRLRDRIEVFTEKLEASSLRAQQDFTAYRNSFSAMYDDSRRILDRQRDILKDLEAGITARPSAIDESLEKFKTLYNGTETKVESPKVFNKFGILLKSIFAREVEPLLYRSTSTLDPFRKQLDFATDNLKLNYRKVVKVAGDMGMRADQLYTESTETTVRKQTDLSKGAQAIFDRYLVLSGTRGRVKVEKDTKPPISTITKEQENDLLKKDINRERRSVEQQLRGLERDSIEFFKEQKGSFEAQVKELQESFRATNTAYEELINKRRASLYYTQQTDANLKRILDMIDDDNPSNYNTQGGWQLMRTTEHGFEVYRRFFTGKSSKYGCVMAKGLVKAAPKKLLALFEDDTRTREYNNLFLRGEDLEYVADNTKIQWACTPPVFPFKPRDFVTLIHIRKLHDGTLVYLNTATHHKEKPAGNNGYVRGQIVLAANIMQPVKGKPNLCKVTMMTQLDPGGFAPAPAVNKICLSGPGGFMRNIEIAANKAPNRAVLKEKKRLAKELKKRVEAKAAAAPA